MPVLIRRSGRQARMRALAKCRPLRYLVIFDLFAVAKAMKVTTISVTIAGVLLLLRSALVLIGMQRPPQVVSCCSIAPATRRRLHFPALNMLTRTCSCRPLLADMGAASSVTGIVYSNTIIKPETSTCPSTLPRRTCHVMGLGACGYLQLRCLAVATIVCGDAAGAAARRTAG